tara:strand:- start:4412 stop:5575 length:1164 start_codon:yes stop_codon:yes gene_type:complete
MPVPCIAMNHLLSNRVHEIDVSGIRRAFQLGAKLEDPINLSIGQPDFAVPQSVKRATIDAIEQDHNGYTLTAGNPLLLDAIRTHLGNDVGWDMERDDLDVIVTSGTSGALLLSFMALLDPGDEVVVADPYFVVYTALGPMTNATIRLCDTYPDFRMTAERVEPLLNDRTKIVLVNSPANPTGIVLSKQELDELADLCRSRGIMLISDEIYDLFTWPDHLDETGHCPSPARGHDDMLLIRGFGKTYGCTGWRLGFAAGPSWLISEMAKLQQYSFVCAPSMAQAGAVAALHTDMQPIVDRYHARSRMVVDAFSDVTELPEPGGAIYAFVEVPERLGRTATQFCEEAINRNVIVIPGSVFSERDTHFRLSIAADEGKLAQGLEILRGMMT